MKKDIEDLPPSMTREETGRAARVKLRMGASGAELAFFDEPPRAKLHGLLFGAGEAPSVVLRGRKVPVQGVY